jgi:aspartate carbamoyltransferase catalytic subunit
LGRIGYSDGDSTPMKITIVGDLMNGRTVHSLLKILCLFSGIHINYISPKGLGIPNEIYEYAKNKGLEQCTDISLEEAVIDTDVLYVTRIQKERFINMDDYERAIQDYCINTTTLELAKPDMIVMHPLPRTCELSSEIDKDPRAAYFRQMENGMYMRMAILENILCNI